MLRRSSLQRKAPLTAKTGLRASSWLRAKAAPRKRPRDTGPTKKTRDAVKQRANWTCERCAARRGKVIHHRDPRGMGGSTRPEVNEASNLVFICVQCHDEVESKRHAAIGAGFLIPDGLYPTLTPIEMWHKDKFGWWLLKDDGSAVPHRRRRATSTGGFLPPHDNNTEEAS